MSFKSAYVYMVPDADPKVHRASIKTGKSEMTAVAVPADDVDRVVAVCKELVQQEGTQEFLLCPGFTHGMVAAVKKAVGDGVAVAVGRCDGPDGGMVAGILAREGWFGPGQ